FRIYTLYKPLKTFFAIGTILMFAGLALGARFVWAFSRGDRAGHIQSLILCAVFLVTGFQTWLIALLADLIAVNRRLSEEVLIRIKRLESPERRPQQQRTREERRDRPQRPQSQPTQPQPLPQPQREPEKPATQWVWLLDDEKEKEKEAPPAQDPAEQPEPQGGGNGGRRRRRRRGGVRHAGNLPGNRGKHLDVDNGE
ncbi:MAG TPA: hypothetical protein VF381_12030, partial [Thermoanaerobaculia bacterium]